MQTSSLLESLMGALCRLPGVGPRSAQRMAFYLLKEDRKPGLQLASILRQAMIDIKYCCDCRTLTEHIRCAICSNPKRQQNRQLCVVETPADIPAIEQTGQYFGQYFVLMGHLSPLDGIGPKDIGLDLFKKRLTEKQFKEVILATNPTVEGEVTATYLAQICAEYQVTATRIAHGVPIGGELDMIDGTTLSHSFIGRQKIEL